MEHSHLLLRVGEIFLKGKNRRIFEKKLQENIAKITGCKSITSLRGRFIVPYFENHQSLQRVFGLVSYSPAIHVENDIEKIKQAAALFMKSKKGTFKVETKRSEKRFPIKSPDVTIQVGKHIEENTNATFSFSNPDTIVNIEINQRGTFLFTQTIYCAKGIPTGIEGNVALLVENEASLLAGLLFMKRGASIIPFACNDKDISLLQKFSPKKLTLQTTPNIAEIEKYCQGKNVSFLVSGQIYEEYEKYPTSLAPIRPLIAYNQKQVEKELSFFKSII